MKILVLGAGMYVTGREESGNATVLSSLIQTSKELSIDSVTIIAKSASNKKTVLRTAQRINHKLKASLKVEYKAVDLGGAGFSSLIKKEKYDCAIICLPDHLHFAAAKKLLENRIHCLIVKPLTPTLKTAKQLVAIQKQKNLYAAVEFHKRFDETNLYIKRALDEKTLGDLLYFTVDYSQRVHIPLTTFKAWADKTNIFQYLGVHYVDLIYFLTGYLPVRAMAVGTQKLLINKGLKTYDSIHATIQWQHPRKKNDDFFSILNTNWIDPNNTSALSDQKYKVVGTQGRIECDQKNRGIELVHKNFGAKHVNPYFSEYLYNPDGQLEFGGYGHKSINLFVKDIENLLTKQTSVAALEKTRPTFRQALISTAVLEAVEHSLRNQSQWSKINVTH